MKTPYQEQKNLIDSYVDKHEEDYSAGSGVSKEEADYRLRYRIEKLGWYKTALFYYIVSKLLGWISYKE